MPRTVSDIERMRNFGIEVHGMFENYKKDRWPKEQQWLKNLRQWNGIYDDDILKLMRDGGSRAYPRITRIKGMGTIARIMEMLFPQSERNWSVSPTPRPNLSQQDMTAAIKVMHDKMKAEKEGFSRLTDEEVEKAIYDFAFERSQNMAIEIDDALKEMKNERLCKKVVTSGVRYGLGILKGPQSRQEQVRTWTFNDRTNQYQAQPQTRLHPLYDVVPCWNYYPDLSAKSFDDMDMEFERNPMSKSSLLKLKARTDFIPEQIDEVIRRYPRGNYEELYWEVDIRNVKTSDRSNLSSITSNKYEFIEGWGIISGHQLRAAGEDIPEGELGNLFVAQIAFIGDVIIKAVKTPYARQKSPFHKFVFIEDDSSLLGQGLPEHIRDSQMAICFTAVCLLDNVDAVCGPILEGDTDLLMPGQSLEIHGFKMFLKEGGKGFPSNSGNRAVQDVRVQAHIAEIISVFELFMRLADMETMLPPPALGDTQVKGSEALRTTGNASMILGAAALPVRDVVRNFDDFTVSYITSLYDWMMQFREKPSIKGDMMVLARGASSLIAKEIRATQLDNLAVTLNQDERDHIKDRAFVEARLRARDLDRELLEDPEIVQQKRDARAAQQNAAMQLQEEQIRAEIREVLANATNKLAQAQKNTTGATMEVFTTLLEALGGGQQPGQTGQSKAAARPAAR